MCNSAGNASSSNQKSVDKQSMKRRKFAIAPMMDWTDRAEKQSVIST